MHFSVLDYYFTMSQSQRTLMFLYSTFSVTNRRIFLLGKCHRSFLWHRLGWCLCRKWQLTCIIIWLGLIGDIIFNNQQNFCIYTFYIKLKITTLEDKKISPKCVFPKIFMYYVVSHELFGKSERYIKLLGLLLGSQDCKFPSIQPSFSVSFRNRKRHPV